MDRTIVRRCASQDVRLSNGHDSQGRRGPLTLALAPAGLQHFIQRTVTRCPPWASSVLRVKLSRETSSVTEVECGVSVTDIVAPRCSHGPSLCTEKLTLAEQTNFAIVGQARYPRLTLQQSRGECNSCNAHTIDAAAAHCPILLLNLRKSDCDQPGQRPPRNAINPSDEFECALWDAMRTRGGKTYRRSDLICGLLREWEHMRLVTLVTILESIEAILSPAVSLVGMRKCKRPRQVQHGNTTVNKDHIGSRTAAAATVVVHKALCNIAHVHEQPLTTIPVVLHPVHPPRCSPTLPPPRPWLTPAPTSPSAGSSSPTVSSTPS